MVDSISGTVSTTTPGTLPGVGGSSGSATPGGDTPQNNREKATPNVNAKDGSKQRFDPKKHAKKVPEDETESLNDVKRRKKERKTKKIRDNNKGEKDSEGANSGSSSEETNSSHTPTEVVKQPDNSATGPTSSNASNNQPPQQPPAPSTAPQPGPTTPGPTQPGGTNPQPGQYDPQRGTPQGLKNIKAGAIKGPAHAGTYAMAHAIQEAVPNLYRFTAFNDEYHQGTSSFHAKGLALDFTVTNGVAGSRQAAARVQQLMDQAGIRATIINEYVRPSARSTGGHIHVNYATYADAAKGQQIFGAGGGGTGGGGTGGTPGGGGTGGSGTGGGQSGPFNPTQVASGPVTMADRVSLAKAAGFTDAQAVTMGAISQAESSGNSNAHNPNANTGDNSYGLWQINMIGNLGVQRDALFRRMIPGYNGYDSLKNPWINAQAAKIIFNQQGFRAWTTYTSGKYSRYVNDAVNGIGAGSEGPNGGSGGGGPGGGGTGGGGSPGGSAGGGLGGGNPSTGTTTGPGLYPSTANGLNVGSNAFGGGQPQDVMLSFGQFIQQQMPEFQSVQSFTTPPPNASNPGAYTSGLAMDFTISLPTITRSQTATQFIQDFLTQNEISGVVTNFYLTATPISSGYIHVEISPADAAKAYQVFALLTEFNLEIQGIIIVNGKLRK